MSDKNQQRVSFNTQACTDKVTSKGILSLSVSDSNKRADLSDMKPSAQYTRPCKAVNKVMSDYEVNVINLLSSVSQIPTLSAYLSLLFTYGLRISELLSCNSKDMVDRDIIRVKGCKGSNDRILRVVDNRDYWNKKYLVDYQLSYDYNRFFIYRLLKQHGIYEVFGDNKKFSVTHIARHMIMLKYKDKGLNDQQLCEVLGHRSIKSIKWYMQDVKAL